MALQRIKGKTLNSKGRSRTRNKFGRYDEIWTNQAGYFVKVWINANSYSVTRIKR